MTKLLFSRYQENNLQVLAEQLSSDYYDQLVDSCEKICNMASKLTLNNFPPSVSLFASLYARILEEIRQEIRICRAVITPCISELYEQPADCCTNIAERHQVKGIKAAHAKLMEIISRIDLIMPPLRESEYHVHHECKILQNELIVLNHTLTELFCVEEAVIMPKIKMLKRQRHLLN
ncbi:hypothetical protein ACTHGU_21795 [Chitinophagaceae bacterium MMS25-I14]